MAELSGVEESEIRRAGRWNPIKWLVAISTAYRRNFILHYGRRIQRQWAPLRYRRALWLPPASITNALIWLLRAGSVA